MEGVEHACTIFFCGPHCTNNLCGSRHTKTFINWHVWFIFKPHYITMSTYRVEVNTNLVAVYYNRAKPNLFMVNHVDLTLSNLKDQLDQINGLLNHRDTKIVESINVCRWIRWARLVHPYEAPERRRRYENHVLYIWSSWSEGINRVKHFLGQVFPRYSGVLIRL